MRVFLTGVSCVGKSTIGEKLAGLLGVNFFDLDHEIESFFGTSIERLRNRFITPYSFECEAAKALVHLLNRPESRDCVIALSPSGLIGGFWRVMRKTDGIKVVLNDKPENILDRITFYDIDSRPLEKNLTLRQKKLQLKDIRKDITYYRKSYERADMHVDISGLNADEAARRVHQALENVSNNPGVRSSKLTTR